MTRTQATAPAGGILMSTIEKLHNWLTAGATPDCDRIFSAALEHAEPAYFDRFVRSLLERGHPASWAGLIEHYPRLQPGTQQRLQADPNLMRAGITDALKSASARSRENALLALQDRPDPRLAYALPYLLRDPSSAVRARAAKVLRETAAAFLEQGEPAPSDTNEASLAYAAQREHLVAALAEALRTYKIHHRLEAIEPCLWLARDLESELWTELTASRSACAYVVAEHLPAWNDARLAPFLLQALTRPSWRKAARALLADWDSLDEFVALLRNNDLLADGRARRYMRTIKRPKWFDISGKYLELLPPDLRGLAPGWLCCVGFGVDEQMAYLSQWLDAPDANVQQAAATALSTLNVPDAEALLRDLAGGRSPARSYARWHLAAEPSTCSDSALAEPATPQAAEQPGQPDEPAPALPGDTPPDLEFETLWELCRSVSPRENGELIKLLRENLDIWRSRLITQLRSSEPRDRLLALQIIGSPELARQFREALEDAQHDPVEAIRRLVRNLLEPVAAGSAPGELQTAIHADAARAAAATPTDVQSLAQIRGQVRDMLAEIASEDLQPSELATLVQRLRPLLRKISGVGEPDQDRLLEKGMET